MGSVPEPTSPAPRRPVRTTVLALTVAAALLSLVSIAAILVEYFSHVSVWPPLMAVGLWGLPLAFIGLVSMVLISVRDRRREDMAARGA